MASCPEGSKCVDQQPPPSYYPMHSQQPNQGYYPVIINFYRLLLSFNHIYYHSLNNQCIQQLLNCLMDLLMVIFNKLQV